MTIPGFLAYAAALTVAAVIPGPQIFAIVAQAVRHGIRHAMWMTTGMVFGDVIYLGAVLGGLAFLAKSLTAVLIGIKWAGVIYLCWLAIQYWNAPDARGNEAEVNSTRKEKSAFLSGMLVTLGNPKSMLFYISIMPSIVQLRTVTKLDGLILLAITATILATAQFPFVLAAARCGRVVSSPRRLRWLNRSASACMGSAAVTIALRR